MVYECGGYMGHIGQNLHLNIPLQVGLIGLNDNFIIDLMDE